MSFLLPLVCFLCIFRNSLGHHGDDGGSHAEEISYQDILDVNGSCYPLDSCYEPREKDPVKNYEYMCSCNSQCWEIGTCCIDSPERRYTPNHKCMDIGDPNGASGYYMIYGCPDNTHRDSIWKIPCEAEWNGEDDILMLSPVTSLETSRTYKNYYCFKCHERTDEYVSWNIFLQSNHNVSEDARDYRVAYDRVRKTWMANLDNLTSIPVSLMFLFPYDLEQTAIECEPGMISDCADDWTDTRMRHKCLAYTAVVYEYRTIYKNVHCALCNYRGLDSLDCRRSAPFVGSGKGTLNFQHLVDINKDDSSDKAGSDGKCGKDYMWDPYGKKCREISCALPGYVVKDDRCVPP